MKYFEEAQKIWEDFVPPAGQASTVQGEMLRAVEKLRDEAQRNGNMNWDEGFEIFIRYLSNRLTDSQVYSKESILETMKILTRLRDFEDPYTDEDYYDILGDKVVEYFKFHGTTPHEENHQLHR